MVTARKSPAARPSSTRAVAATAAPAAARGAAKPATPMTSGAVAARAKASSVQAKDAAKPAKEKKPKLVRDSFTIPKAEYVVLEMLKQRAGRLSSPRKKGELLRAGIKALAAMPDPVFLSALQAVPMVKTGRPSRT